MVFGLVYYLTQVTVISQIIWLKATRPNIIHNVALCSTQVIKANWPRITGVQVKQFRAKHESVRLGRAFLIIIIESHTPAAWGKDLPVQTPNVVYGNSYGGIIWDKLGKGDTSATGIYLSCILTQKYHYAGKTFKGQTQMHQAAASLAHNNNWWSYARSLRGRPFQLWSLTWPMDIPTESSSETNLRMDGSRNWFCTWRMALRLLKGHQWRKSLGKTLCFEGPKCPTHF